MSATSMETGVINSTVVTLSRREETTPVRMKNKRNNINIFPLATFTDFIARNSNKPVLLKKDTIIIIPSNSPKVLKSTKFQASVGVRNPRIIKIVEKKNTIEVLCHLSIIINT